MNDPLEVFTALVLRDGNVCYLDGLPPTDDDPLEIEHTRSRAAGGGNELSNLKLAHRRCNRIKGSATVAI